MMRFSLLFVIPLMICNIAMAQEVCDSPDESMADPNSITKCAVEDTKEANGKKSSKISIEVSTRRRIKRVRDKATGVGNVGSTHQIASIDKSNLLVGKLEIASNTTKALDVLPFNIVDEVPLFSKCKDVSLLKQSKCFSEQITSHIIRNFKYPSKALAKGIEGRVLVQFIINKEGKVEKITTRSPQNTELLKIEAKRLINKLPKFIPGRQNGQPIKVRYGIPITFKIPGKSDNISSKKKVNKSRIKKKKNTFKKVKEIIITDAITFNTVESIPQFKACKGKTGDENLACFNQKMVKHIQKNFYYPEEAAVKGIEGRVWVNFIIDKKGEVTNIKMRGPKGGQDLEEEAKRMVAKLPAFIPGKHQGKTANVKYNIPIVFKLN